MVITVAPLIVAECPVCRRLEIVGGGLLREHGRLLHAKTDTWETCRGSGTVLPEEALFRYQLAVKGEPRG
jgi:hypothetical protein